MHTYKQTKIIPTVRKRRVLFPHLCASFVLYLYFSVSFRGRGVTSGAEKKQKKKKSKRRYNFKIGLHAWFLGTSEGVCFLFRFVSLPYIVCLRSFFLVFFLSNFFTLFRHSLAPSIFFPLSSPLSLLPSLSAYCPPSRYALNR